MEKAPIRVLVVDDFEPFRRLVVSMLKNEWELQVVREASDGLEAVQKANQLQPDLILLDIGLPGLNGIEVARQIRKLSPASNILFVSQNFSADMAKEALSNGAGGYVLKSDAASELFPAIRAVLEGKRFISSSLAEHGLTGWPHPQTGARILRYNTAKFSPKQNEGSTRRHEVGFYPDDPHFLAHVTPFIEATLKDGNVAIVMATESHRASLLSELHARGLDIRAVIEQDRYIQVDAAETLSMFMVNGILDVVRFLELFEGVIVRARMATKRTNPRIAVFGECVDLLIAQGNANSAIQMEKLGNKLTKIHDDLNILCGYCLGRVKSGMDSHTFQQICEEHSAVHSGWNGNEGAAPLVAR